jgi:tRNA G46 methylase TrmB
MFCQRLDRVYQTFLHSIMRTSTEPHNLAIMGGDATLVLPEVIHDSCVQQIFVNHPEPPERASGGEDMSQGKHMLTGIV